ncbi:UNVERIFIED_CONTAM: RING finger protein 39, partial [Eudyptes pachyrhynchus]
MVPSGLPERGPLAQLARETSCPACGQPLRDPVLFACNHSCCRRCLPVARPGEPPPAAAAATAVAFSCPRCCLPCAPRRLRTPVALAVESRIAQRLVRGTPGPPRRRPQRCSLGAQLRADAAPPRPPSPKEPPGG